MLCVRWLTRCESNRRRVFTINQRVKTVTICVGTRPVHTFLRSRHGFVSQSTSAWGARTQACTESSPVLCPLETIRVASALCAPSSWLDIWLALLVSELCSACCKALCALWISARIALTWAESEPPPLLATCDKDASSDATIADSALNSLDDELLALATAAPPAPAEDALLELPDVLDPELDAPLPEALEDELDDAPDALLPDVLLVLVPVVAVLLPPVVLADDAALLAVPDADGVAVV